MRRLGLNRLVAPVALVTFSRREIPYLTHNWRFPNTLQAELETMHWTKVKKALFLHRRLGLNWIVAPVALITFSRQEMPYLTHNWRFPNTLQAELEIMHWTKVNEAFMRRLGLNRLVAPINLITFSRREMPYLTRNWRFPNSLQAELETMH
jgi:hypothetical protein